MEDWTTGYTRTELNEAEEKFGLRFPPDLFDLLCERRPVNGYDWRTDADRITEALQWPLEGILFDVEENQFWLSNWGERPHEPEERAEIVTDAVAQAPKLIPILSHRYIPQEPHERGNPVFSVYQTDIIYYGADLDDYFRREFEFSGRPAEAGPMAPARYIRFWSDIVELEW